MLLVSVGVASAQSASCQCEPSPEVRAALKTLDSPELDRLSYKQQRARRLEILAELRRAHPGDVFIERQYQDNSKINGDFEPETVEEYRKLAGEHPQDPIYIYLYARALVGTKTPDAIAGFERSLRVSPGFAWAHLALANVYSQRLLEDKAKNLGHLKAFMHLCPNSFDGYSDLRGLSDTEFLTKTAAELRAKLEADTEGDHVFDYPRLWQLEFKLATAADHEKIRKRVAEDVDRIKGISVVMGSAQGLWVIREGYNLAGDKGAKQATEDQIVARFPQSGYASQVVYERWNTEHPWPGDTNPQQKAAYYKALLARTEAELKAKPDDEFAWMFRLEALGELKDHPASEVADAADHVLKAAEENRGFGYFSPSMQIQTAAVYLQRNLRLEQIPGLIEDGMKEDQSRIDRVLRSDLLTPQVRKMETRQLDFSRWTAWGILAQAYINTHQGDKAMNVIVTMEDWLAKTKPEASAEPNEKESYKYHQSVYWEFKGRLAESNNLKADAMLFYQRAISLSGAKIPAAESDSDDTLAVRAAKLWKEMGGSNEGLQALFTPVERVDSEESSTGWLSVKRSLPPFDLPDINGKKWSLAGLKGKVAFVNVWATWCGPCRMELPHLQKLYDRLKDRKDVVVFSLNVDENPGLIEPFLKENSFTFPVVPAFAYVEDFLKLLSIPRNWILTPDGALKTEEIGFGGDGDKWVNEAVDQIDKAKAN